MAVCLFMAENLTESVTLAGLIGVQSEGRFGSCPEIARKAQKTQA
jgi:hypothetical protein